jgi:RHS repeat-associated protein
MKKKKILNHYHFNARSYDAGLSRFFAPDLLWEYDPNVSLYAYCNNNPINSKDSSGLTGQDEKDNPLVPFRSFIKDKISDYENQIIMSYRLAEMGVGGNGVGGNGVGAPVQGALGIGGAVNPGGNSWNPFPTIQDQFKSKPENPYNSMSRISNSNFYKETTISFIRM